MYSRLADEMSRLGRDSLVRMGDSAMDSEARDAARQSLERVARLKTQAAIDAAGASAWMDGGTKGDMGHRIGARELIGLVSRCPRLTTLNLHNFDFGNVPADYLHACLPQML